MKKRNEKQVQGEEERRRYREQNERELAREARTNEILVRHERTIREEAETNEEEQQPNNQEQQQKEQKQKEIHGGLEGAVVVGERIERLDGEEDKDEEEEEEEEEEESEKEEAPLEPFNLKQEREEGYFDKSGHFIENKEPRTARDAWLEDEYDAKYAKEMKKKSEKQKTKSLAEKEAAAIAIEKEAEQAGIELESNTEKKRKLLSDASELLINDKENVSNALRRIGGKDERFGKLTDIADCLLRAGFLNVYSETRLDLKNHIRNLDHKRQRNQDVDDDDDEKTEIEPKKQHLEIKWEYKIDGDEKIYGPFDCQLMETWKLMGFFNNQSQKFYVRHVGSSDFVLYSISIDFFK